jgi:hypothetical protein
MLSSGPQGAAVNAAAAEAFFIAGTIPPMLAGGLHAALTLVDTVRPRYFTPTDAGLNQALERTPMRFGGRAAPSMWRAWLGFNISHGLGAFTFGLLCLLIALEDFDLVERIDVIRPLAIAIPATYLVVALRFWFWAPVLVAGTATVCFTIAAVLSA